MVSFSEYGHDELPNKTLTYGVYGVALDKRWAVEKGLSPVNYIERNSQVASGLIALLKSRQKNMLPTCLRLPVIQLKCFVKHVRGHNSHVKVDDFDFKSENEWRYVPTKGEIGGNRISENFSTYNKNKSKYDDRLKPYSLKFSHEDIKYIYVATESERRQIISDFKLAESQVVLSAWKQKDKR